MSPFSGALLSGGIEVICGPMFSGKTEELIRRVRRAQIARQKVQLFKPAIDNRYSETEVVSHSSQALEATVVSNALEILRRVLDSTRVVAIDEVQFFGPEITKVISKLALRGCRVICAGLDQDYTGKPFGPMPELLAMADSALKVQAICTVCGAQATKTHRKQGNQSEQVLVGETDIYEARCRTHFEYVDESEEMPLFPELFQASEKSSPARS